MNCLIDLTAGAVRRIERWLAPMMRCLLKAEASAKARRLGFWNQTNPVLPVELRRGNDPAAILNKYPNNVIEQDHHFLQRLIKPGMGFKSFNTARRTIKGYEAMHMLRKGQVIGVPKGDVKAQLNFMAQIFGVVV